jgi:hypothetical protein
VTARGHFASGPAYPRQASSPSSSIFNYLPNWLDFMDRRLGSTCTPGYFSRLGEAGTSAITIIDTEEESDSRGPSTPPRDPALLLDSPADHPPCSFPIFSAYFPGEEPIILGCPESGCVCPAPIILRSNRDFPPSSAASATLTSMRLGPIFADYRIRCSVSPRRR